MFVCGCQACPLHLPLLKLLQLPQLPLLIAAAKHSAASSNTFIHVRTSPRYEILVDGESKIKGDLMVESSFKPPFFTPQRIPDPTDKKPKDWVDIPE